MVDGRCDERPFFDAYCLAAASLPRATDPTSRKRALTPAYQAPTSARGAQAEAEATAAEERTAVEGPEGWASAEWAPEARAGEERAPAELAQAERAREERAREERAPEELVPEARAPEAGVAQVPRGAGDCPVLPERRAMRVRKVTPWVTPSRCPRPRQAERAARQRMPSRRMHWMRQSCSVSARWTGGSVHPVTSARVVALDPWGNVNVTSAASRRPTAAHRTRCAGAPMPAPPNGYASRAAFVFATREKECPSSTGCSGDVFVIIDAEILKAGLVRSSHPRNAKLGARRMDEVRYVGPVV
jgi:hypothetical protein